MQEGNGIAQSDELHMVSVKSSEEPKQGPSSGSRMEWMVVVFREQGHCERESHHTTRGLCIESLREDI